MTRFKLRNERPFRLMVSQRGRHQFGGPALHSGVIPKGSTVGIQLVLSLDLTDPLMPIESQGGITKFPLYYPFKYGIGGPAIQYAVRSNSEIDILHLSDSEPDESEFQYLQVDELPRAPMTLKPLSYSQARILAFVTTDGYFKPNKADRAILDQLDKKNLVLVGGTLHDLSNAPDIICRNPDCEFNGRRIYSRTVATIPPIQVNGNDEFWWEFQGGGVWFCFVLCYHCGTVIGFNVTS